MPVYEYRCATCGLKFEKLIRSIAAAANGAACPDCGAEGHRQVSTFAAFRKGESGRVTSVAGGGCAGCAGGSCASCGHG